MATLRQQKLARGFVEAMTGEYKPMTKLMEEAGYSKEVARTHQATIAETCGFKEELSRHGFDLAETDAVVRKILHHTERDETKLKASEIIYKRTGANAPEKSQAVNVDVSVDITDERVKALAQEYEQKLR